MSESGSPEKAPKYLPIKPEQALSTSFGNTRPVKREPSMENIHGLVMESRRELKAIERQMIEKDAIEPTPSLEKGIKVAKQDTIIDRQKIGLPPMNEEDMPVALLTPAKLREYSKRIYGYEIEDLGGLSVIGMDTVTVGLFPNRPDYLTARTVKHELNHRWAERETIAFVKPDKKDSIYRRNLLTETRRTGLNVMKIKQGQKGLEADGWYGELLNEIPNAMAEKEFINKVIDPQNGIYKEEGARRKEMLGNYLKSLGIQETPYTMLPDTLENGKQVSLHVSNVHFDSSGNPLKEAPFYVMQLGSDLAAVCGPINGVPFNEMLLRAKVDPKIQPEIQRIMNGYLGKGFYGKLKNANNNVDDLLNILSEVQQKLNPTS